MMANELGDEQSVESSHVLRTCRHDWFQITDVPRTALVHVEDRVTLGLDHPRCEAVLTRRPLRSDHSHSFLRFQATASLKPEGPQICGD
ncbi:hypothetical protein [Sphingomonas melonis]|uniref:Uncharacterized protein n=1 Tax=Sphingomonas melonis TaxID=152682 RepID=A0A7Y9JZX1_9SPHN|nr:hypothetical protein [Sphingomonas melonis]NYD89208.1 hypothetical protein [Sphingomonas melonis]